MACGWEPMLTQCVCNHRIIGYCGDIALYAGQRKGGNGMKVKVTWVSNNPFVLDLRNMSRCSEADVPAEMNYDTIEDFAREATPQGFHLRSIDVEGKVVQYDYNGHKL